MKITNAEVIKSGEKDLIDSITADLDWGAIENIFLTEHNLGIDEDIEYKRGDIIAYNNQVAYKLEFTVKVNLSVLINRGGEYLSVKISEKKDHNESGDSSGYTNPAEVEGSTEKNVTEQKEESAADVKVFSVDNSEKQYINSDRPEKEDRYFEALEQIGSNDPNENAADTIS
jgi:hypothetical protein